jgi:cytochrome c
LENLALANELATPDVPDPAIGSHPGKGAKHMIKHASLLVIGLTTGSLCLLTACGGPKEEAPAAPVETPASVPEATPEITPAPDTVAPPAPLTPAPGPETDPTAAPQPVPASLTVTGAESLPPPYNEANLEDGKGQFAKCRNCHSIVASEGNKIGPNLHGVFSRHPGTAPGFKYSPALAADTHSAWTPEELDEWLEHPGEYLPGNAMFFNGIKSERDRRDVIAYLMIESAK